MKEKIEFLMEPTLIISGFKDQARLKCPRNLLDQINFISADIPRSGYMSMAKKIDGEWTISINQQAFNQLSLTEQKKCLNANERFRDFLVRQGLNVAPIVWR